MNEVDTGTAAWAALSSLLDQALDLKPCERLRWLDQLPPEHDALRPRLARLLAHTSTGNGNDGFETIPKFDDTGAATWTVFAP